MRDRTLPIVLIERRDGSRDWLRPPVESYWSLDVVPEYVEIWAWLAPWKRPSMKATGNVDLTVTRRDAGGGGYTVDTYGRLSQETTPRGRPLWRITEPSLGMGHYRADGTFTTERVAGLEPVPFRG